jgi:hypothetical protein
LNVKPLQSIVGIVGIVGLLGLLSPVGGCRCEGGDEADGEKPAFAPVMAYLMPPDRKQVELMMERRKTGPGKRPMVQPRMLLARRINAGVVYRIRERISGDRWRTAAQLRLHARPDGAWISRQLDLHGKRVGPKHKRLVFPWPVADAKPRNLTYRIFGRRRDGGRRVKARVSVVRHGFSEKVGSRRFGPCLEVREELVPDVGGRMDLRSVYCRGLGRVRIEQRNESLSRGKSVIVDRVIGIRKKE